MTTDTSRTNIDIQSSDNENRPGVDRRAFVRTAGLSAAGMALAGLLSGSTTRTASAAGGSFVDTVTNARIFDLSHIWDENSPIAGVNPPYKMELGATHDTVGDDPNGTRGAFGDGGQLSFTSEVQEWSGQHGAPSIDATGHIGQDGLLFGGVDAAAATRDQRGLGRSGVGANLDMASYPKDLLVNRGVLLDVARYVNGDATPLEGAFKIRGEHLAGAAAAQGVVLKPGDTVLVRTGWGSLFTADPDTYKGDAAAGVDIDGARYLVNHGARVVGNDSLTFEVRPPIAFPPEVPAFQVFPVHMFLIAQSGVNIIENFFLEEIAAAGVHEFVIVVPPLKIRGGTGSALRSFALAPAV